MRALVLRRLAQSIVVMLVVTTIAFSLMHLAPGDPFSASLDNPAVTEEVRQRWRAMYKLDRPLHEQYAAYLGNVARGDLGYSFSKHRPVSAAIAAALPNTIVLMGFGLLGAFAAGIALGVFQGVRRGSSGDRVASVASMFFYSMPDFWLALMIMLAFGYWIPIFPVGGVVDQTMYPYFGFWERVADRLHHLALPVLTLTLLAAAGIARYQRSALLDVVRQDFIRTARAKGAAERTVIGRHALRNALLPVITLVGLAVPSLLGGTVFVETVFSWPGMGLLTVEAVGSRDYPLVMASVIVGGVMVAIGNLAADIGYAAADPRMREG